jgi:hypothetical protein
VLLIIKTRNKEFFRFTKITDYQNEGCRQVLNRLSRITDYQGEQKHLIRVPEDRRRINSFMNQLEKLISDTS